MHPAKTALATLTTTLLLALAISNASANRLSVSNPKFRVVYRSLDFTEAGGEIGPIQCPVTLEGSFHSGTIQKVLGALIGHVTRASVGAASTCTGGSATVLTETLPWHVTYQGFTGTLPRINSVRLLLIGFAIRIHIHLVFEFFCLARTEVNNPIIAEALVEAGGNLTNLIPEEGASIPLTGSGGTCPIARGHFAAPPADGAITLLGNTTQIRITLI